MPTIEPHRTRDPLRASRTVAPPTSISEVAREQLAATIAMGVTEMTAPEDVAGWEAMIGFAEEMLLGMIPTPAPGTTVESMTLGGTPAYQVWPHKRSSERTCLYLHGGALLRVQAGSAPR